MDRVAAFVEVCREARSEPFFGPDDEANFRASQDWKRVTFFLGDRFRFRSALVPFVRLWATASPAYWQATAEILKTCGLPVQLDLAARDAEAQVRWEIERKDPPGSVELPRHKVIGLWLNALVSTAPDSSKELRSEFDSVCKTYGLAAFEFAFRSSAKWVGIRMLALHSRCAEPALDLFRASGHVPSFDLGSPVRIKRREKTTSGSIILREGISDFAPEESFEERLQRLLGQMSNRAFAAVFKYLEASPTELVLAILRVQTFPEFLEAISGRLEFYTFSPDGRLIGRTKEGFRGESWGQEGHFVVFADNVVVTDKHGGDRLDANLRTFREQLLS